MKPNKPGIWEWFNDEGKKLLVSVVDVGYGTPYLRVAWWGGYYNVNDEDDDNPSEWPDRWGNFVGEQGSIPEEQIYSMPTSEERKKMNENYLDNNSPLM